MRKGLIILLTIIINSISLINAQNLFDSKLKLNNDSIYRELLIDHLQFLESDSNFKKFLKKEILYIYGGYSLVRTLDDSVKSRKVQILSPDIILKELNEKGNFYAIEFKPMFFLNNEIRIKIFDIYVSMHKNTPYITNIGYSLYIFEFDCEQNRFIFLKAKRYY
jgi:hypothetical protein